MSKRFTIVLSETEHAELVARAKYLNTSMTQVLEGALRAIVYGNLHVAGDRIIIRKEDGKDELFELKRLTPYPSTPTNGSRETPVPDVPVDTTEYVLNELGQRHPEGHIARMTEDDNKFMYDMGYTPWKPLGKAK